MACPRPPLACPVRSLEKDRGAPRPIFCTLSNVSSGTRQEFRFSPSDESLDDFRYGFETEFGRVWGQARCASEFGDEFGDRQGVKRWFIIICVPCEPLPINGTAEHATQQRDQHGTAALRQIGRGPA